MRRRLAVAQMALLLWASCGIACGAAAGSPAAERIKVVPGIWRGQCNGVRYRFALQWNGVSFVGRGLLWHGMTEVEAMALGQGQSFKTAWEHATCYACRADMQWGEDGVVVQFLDLKQIRVGMNLKPTAHKGVFHAPGVITQLPDPPREEDGGVSAFTFWKEDVLAKPLPFDLEKGKVHRLKCLDAPDYQYLCYLPQSYDHAKPTTVLIHFSRQGDEEPVCREAAEELGWIIVALPGLAHEEILKWRPVQEKRDAVLFDLRRRFNVDPQRLVFSGRDGDARAAAYAATTYPDLCPGLILVSPSRLTLPQGRKIPICFVVGKRDPDWIETDRLLKTARAAGHTGQIVLHEGREEWPVERQTEAVRWLAAGMDKPAAKK
jgi:hypothetical protein